MYFSHPTISDLLSLWEQDHQGPGSVLMILLAEQCSLNLAEIQATLTRLEIPLFGGIFPGLIAGSQAHTQGLVAQVLPAQAGVHLLRLPDRSPERILQALPIPAQPRPTAIVLIDGLMSGVDALLASLFNVLGDQVSYFGGGAGSSSLVQRPCLFDGTTTYQDALLLALVDWPSQHGVRHGWQNLYGPVVATATAGTLLQELNWSPALEVYQQIVEEDSGLPLAPAQFADLAKRYPLGMYKEGNEAIVRDPIRPGTAQDLVCVGEVPENAVLYVLKGEADTLIAAARQAAMDSLLPGQAARRLLVADCISRAIFLGDAFDTELATIAEALPAGGPSPEGMLSLGEISFHGDGILTFFNKTVVVSALYPP